MTEQFEKWARETEIDPSNIFIIHKQTIHFWLTAFVKEVERRADALANITCNENLGWGTALEEVVRDFGLERKP